MNSMLLPASFTFTGIVLMAQMGDPQRGLLIYGPMGIMLAWFMWRFEGLLKEIRNLSHRFDGMTKAMLIVEANRENANPVLKKTAQDMLAKIEARDRT